MKTLKGLEGGGPDRGQQGAVRESTHTAGAKRGQQGAADHIDPDMRGGGWGELQSRYPRCVRNLFFEGNLLLNSGQDSHGRDLLVSAPTT